PARPKSGAKLVIAALFAFIIAIAGFLYWFNRPSSPPQNAHLTISVQTEPAGAMVVLGDHMQRGPATFENLEPRKYNLRIMSPGYDPIETTLDLGSKKPSGPQLFRLVRSKGALELQSEQAGTQFTLRSEDGQIVRGGPLPAKIADLPTGKY